MISFSENSCNIYTEKSSHYPELEEYGKTISLFLNYVILKRHSDTELFTLFLIS